MDSVAADAPSDQMVVGTGATPHCPQSKASMSALTQADDDDLELFKLGYESVLARGWGAFDNFACSFSALYCIGGIRVLFYIAISAGGPAAM